MEAAQVRVRTDPDWHPQFLHLAMRRERRIAKVAMARKLAIRLSPCCCVLEKLIDTADIVRDGNLT